MDAPNFALGSILSQPGKDGQSHLVAVQFTTTEINYEVRDKELLVVVDSFEQWRQFLEGSFYQILIYSDHKNITYFQTARL